MLALPAHARTTKIEIMSRTVAFGGYSFAGVGQYEKITGVAYGEVDPDDPKNAVITDIELAPKNANGKVEYAHNFYILKPLDLSKGNHKMMYEPPNRGGKTYRELNRTPVSGALVNDPGAITDTAILADSFLWTRGYTTAWSGWENGLGDINDPTNYTATAMLPVAKNSDGSTITGPAYDYIVTSGASFGLVYPAASLSKAPADAKLTHRVHLDDPPQMVDPSGWDYNASGTAIHLTTGNFVGNDIYEFSYIAKDPTVNGLGLAAIRDFASFLRYGTTEQGNPLAGDVTRIYTETSSQPARTLNDFTHLGFNQDEDGRKVFDGMLQWIGAGDGLNMNYRWSETKRTNRNRQDLLYLEGLFPFANPTAFDPISGETDGRYKKCTETNTCPLAMELYSSNEFWVKGGSLMSTDPTGTYDLPDQAEARLYLISSKQHGGPTIPPTAGTCQQLRNPLPSQEVQRALFQDLDEWSTKQVQPPASRVPRLDDGTLVAVPDPALTNGLYVGIPGVTYTGLETTRYRFDYGPNFYATGIPTINPPIPPGFSGVFEKNPQLGPIYPTFVPKWDSDGNEIAGIRLPELSVPLATYTGWALRSGVWANDGCEGSGQYVPFARTRAERIASGDPRPSVEERYKAFGQYRSAVKNAVDDMVKNRLMLCEDTTAYVERLIDAGLAAGVPAPHGHEPMYPDIPHCN
jgi:hypothetical protein